MTSPSGSPNTPEPPRKPFRKPWLPMRVRKLIGLVAMLGFLFFYALLIMTLAVAGWAPESGFAEFVFYLVTGLGWTPPAAFIIWWMQRPDTPPARPTV